MRIFILLILLNLFTLDATRVSAQVNTQDSLALVDLYNNTNGAAWAKHTNWLTTQPVSTWFGVILSGDRVVQINLPNNNLKGSLPVSIGNLNALQVLNFFITS